MKNIVDRASVIFLDKMYNVFFDEIEDDNVDEYANNIYATLSEVIKDLTDIYDSRVNKLHDLNESGKIYDQQLVKMLTAVTTEYSNAKAELKLQCENEIKRATNLHDKVENKEIEK